MNKKMDIYAELDDFVEENEGQVTLTDVAKHFAEYGYQYAVEKACEWLESMSVRIADKLGKTSPNVPTPLPCYAPNGICTNPQRDCINCPKIGTGGTWSTSTSIKAKGEMFQEKFNDSKED